MLDLTTEVSSTVSEAWRFELELGSYLVKIAGNHREVAQAIRLRSRVFRDDFGAQCDSEDEYWDWSALDDKAAHLIVQSRETGEVVGTYRLILSSLDYGFYSQSEFDLSGFLTNPGLKLELSRACVDPAARTGVVMALLWKGLGEAIRRSGARYLFGCSSLLTEDPEEVKAVLENLEAEGMTCPEHRVSVLTEFELTEKAAEVVARTGQIELPPLLRLYLRAGAKVAPAAAHDRIFRCVDLLTILDVAALNPAMARKYGLIS